MKVKILARYCNKLPACMLASHMRWIGALTVAACKQPWLLLDILRLLIDGAAGWDMSWQKVCGVMGQVDFVSSTGSLCLLASHDQLSLKAMLFPEM